MAKTIRTPVKTLDDELIVGSNSNEDASSVLEMLKNFAYYLVENCEVNLNFCHGLLEQRTVPTQPNSIYTNVLSMLVSATPKVGSAIGNVLSKGELMIFEKIDKRNSKILADFIYYYSDHKDDFRVLLIQSAVDIFYSFEYQFRKLRSNTGQKRAMQKLAKDASDRIFNYLLKTKQTKDITRTEITKGILLGDSKRNLIGVRAGETVIIDNNTCKTDKLYKKTGIVIVEEHTFYKNKDTNTEKYGHRRLLPWEQQEDVKEEWEQETGFELPNYYLTGKEELLTIIRDYIMSKNANDEARLERENFNKEAEVDRKIKHEEALRTFHDGFKELLRDLKHHYKIINDNHSGCIRKCFFIIIFFILAFGTREFLIDVFHKQYNEVLGHEIVNKLQDVNEDVCGSKVIFEDKTILQHAIDVLKNKPDVVAIETKENGKKKLKDVIKEELEKINPGPKMRRGMRKILKKLRLYFF